MKGQTTDGSTITLGTVQSSDNEAGLLKVSVVGFEKAGGGTVTGVKVLRYKKVAGTLTLGTASDDLAIETDTALSGATFAITSVSNVITITVTGKASKAINWYAKANRAVVVDY